MSKEKDISIKDYANHKDLEEQEEKEYKVGDSWSPNWVRLISIGYHSTQAIDNHGHLYRSGADTPNNYIDVPENLADDISSGLIDPTRYTREELEQMALERHMRDEEVNQMINEINNSNEIINENYNNKGL